jgi:putative pyruvate formate lyase activating enzyme
MGALLIAYRKGLSIPLVYNCGGYESIDMLRLWDGVMDVYMPDMKYTDPEKAAAYSSAPDYPEINRAAIIEMARQAGPLVLDDGGVAIKGLLVRHLVLPENVSGTDEVLRFISEKVSPQTHVSLMRQYFPAHRAHVMPPMDRKISDTEYDMAKSCLERFGMEHGWVQD